MLSDFPGAERGYNCTDKLISVRSLRSLYQDVSSEMTMQVALLYKIYLFHTSQ